MLCLCFLEQTGNELAWKMDWHDFKAVDFLFFLKWINKTKIIHLMKMYSLIYRIYIAYILFFIRFVFPMTTVVQIIFTNTAFYVYLYIHYKTWLKGLHLVFYLKLFLWLIWHCTVLYNVCCPFYCLWMYNTAGFRCSFYFSEHQLLMCICNSSSSTRPAPSRIQIGVSSMCAGVLTKTLKTADSSVSR